MKKFFQFAIVAVAAIVMVSCGNKSEANAEGAEPATEEQTAGAESQEVKEGTMGPCTVECAKFSVDIPAEWEVRKIQDNEISVGKEYAEGLNFVYDDAANFKQECQIIMNISGMQDLGEKTYGSNTYGTFLWKQDAGDSFAAILKIGDGESGVIKVNTSNVKTADNEVVLKVLESLKLK